MVAPIYIPTSSSREFPFPATLPSLVICWVLVNRLIDILRSVRWYPMICIFWCWASYHVPIDHLYIFFVYLFIQLPCPFLIGLSGFSFVFFWCLFIWNVCVCVCVCSIRSSRTNTPRRCPFHYRGLECKSRKWRDT